MSRGTQLQEMEVKTQQSKTAVNANAKPGDPMPTMADPGTGLASVEDLGGPTPENSKPDDNSNMLKTPGATLKQVKDIVNKNAKPADPMPAGMKEEEEVEGEVVSEQDTDEELDEISENQEDDLHNKVEQAITEEPAEEEEVVAEDSVEEIDVSADVEALLQGEELSEEFQEKAKTIFEAAINSKVDAIQKELETIYSEKLAEEIESTKISLTERVDSYLEYVADEWLHENQLAVDQGLKAEMSESFMTGLKGLFEEHYVSVPEEKYDVLESMVNKLDEMESKLNEQIDKNIALNKRLSESTSDGILSEVSEGLAITQKEKLASLAESVEFESEANYREKLVTLRNSYFPNSAPSAQRDNSEFIAEGTSNDSTKVAGNVAKYVDALQRFSKK
tara:strand:- start:108 stop:1283 length:1176 start_codon:yes stop_codon:yes gene_type:complete